MSVVTVNANLSRISRRVTTRARTVHLPPTLLAVVVGVLYLVGWLAAKLVTAVWFVVVWVVVAVKVGWDEARGVDVDGPA